MTNTNYPGWYDTTFNIISQTLLSKIGWNKVDTIPFEVAMSYFKDGIRDIVEVW